MGVREITTNPKQSLQNAHHQICDDLCNIKLMASTFLSSTRREVVVAQVVELWHSVWAGRVQIPGQTLGFFRSELLSINSHWVLGFFYERIIEWCILFLLLSCFLSSFTIAKIFNFKLTMYQEKGKIHIKRGRERPIFKKVLPEGHRLKHSGRPHTHLLTEK